MSGDIALCALLGVRPVLVPSLSQEAEHSQVSSCCLSQQAQSFLLLTSILCAKTLGTDVRQRVLARLGHEACVEEARLDSSLHGALLTEATAEPGPMWVCVVVTIG